MAISVVAMVLLGVGLVVFWIEPLGVLGLLERLTPNFIYRVRTERPLVALSFDDGPHPEFTSQVLEILERHDARATFFLIGERARRHPELVSRIGVAGHEVGNHYFRNGSTLLHSDAQFAAYLEKTERAIGMTAVRKLFRPPGGVARPRQLRLARARGTSAYSGARTLTIRRTFRRGTSSG